MENNHNNPNSIKIFDYNEIIPYLIFNQVNSVIIENLDFGSFNFNFKYLFNEFEKHNITNEKISSIKFQKCIFSSIYFGQETIKNNFTFNNCIFNNYFQLEKATLDHNYLHFYNSIFYGHVNISQTILGDTYKIKPYVIILIYFRNCTFYNYFNLTNIFLTNFFIKLSNCIFKKIVDLYEVNCECLEILNCKSEEKFLIWSPINHDFESSIKKIYLNDIELNNELYISNYYIEKLDISNFKINDTGILRTEKNIIQTLSFHTLINQGIIYINQIIVVKEFELNFIIRPGTIDVNETKLDQDVIKNRNTARILKDATYRSNNTIEALKYKAIEMKLYKKEKPPISTIILLWLNWISNKHGLSWLRGVLFTLVVAFIFFCLIMIFGLDCPICNQYEYFNLNVFGDLWVKYLDVLNVLNFRDRLSGSTLNPIGETLFFVSKIAISYGMFQTVSAFRKYGKL